MTENEKLVSLEYQLRIIADFIKIQGRSILHDFQVSEQQFLAIQWLSEDVMTVGQLAQQMGLAVSTTSEMIDQLIIKQCVRREKDQQDKRKVNIILEPKSDEIIETMIAKRQQYIAQLMSEFTQQDKDHLTTSVEKLYESLKEEENE